MFTDKQLDRYADILLWGLKTARTKIFKKNDVVLIRYDMPAVRLAEIIYAKLLDMGIHPVQRTNLTATMEQRFFERANNTQITFQSPGEKELFNRLNGGIFLHAPESITHLGHIDPKKIGKAAVARKHLRNILDARDQAGDFGWTLCAFPTKELARHARISMKAYAAQIIDACFLDRKSPVSHWQQIYRQAASIKKRLNSMKVNFYHIESEHVDLFITPGEKRKWVGISGHNIPSFEIFLSPDWRGTKGIYFSNQPSFRNGNIVRGVRLEFKKGAVVNIDAQQGKNFVTRQLAMDNGANKVGEFSLTDKRFSRINRFMANTLFDENFGGEYGNCHLALGASYADTYKGNQKELTREKKKRLGFNDSALHWDLVNTEKKRVVAYLASGKKKTIYENGEFAL
ncbi:MAG: aminopeptidase [Desulfobacterales bacterium]|jgi:aminopeptidase|nr:aminopeptidase [Desulfobacterales bacterium]